MTFSLISKIAFICNLCMIAALIMKQFDIMSDSALRPMIIIAGYLLSVFFNVIQCIWILVWLIRKQPGVLKHLSIIPIVNGIFLIVQLYLLLK